MLTLNDSIKYLGIEIDTKLNFYNHIKTIEHKLSRLNFYNHIKTIEHKLSRATGIFVN